MIQNYLCDLHCCRLLSLSRVPWQLGSPVVWSLYAVLFGIETFFAALSAECSPFGASTLPRFVALLEVPEARHYGLVDPELTSQLRSSRLRPPCGSLTVVIRVPCRAISVRSRALLFKSGCELLDVSCVIQVSNLYL